MNYVDISTVENMLRFAHAHGNIVSVTFTKRDGSIRNMVARFSYRGTVGGERAYDPDLKKLSFVYEIARDARGRFTKAVNDRAQRKSIPWDRVHRIKVAGQEVMA